MKACPFCGSTDVQISNNSKVDYYGKCNNCCSYSEEASNRDDAMKNWERRSSETETISNEKVLYDYTIMKDGGTLGTGTLVREKRFESHEEKESASEMIVTDKGEGWENAVVEFRLI